ncbi:LCP family protein [Pectinatus brassicae]|uniref:Anionic cell wall polymer biosynthesis LytR-Cps2A-Psr (LCP) family protein n=1 Tax=Pectinatus brassicae TaxID=862415 RepID=A0A840UYU4_9FIRM|nr:LCP family protein [Pectinatus brassicae]MBB5337535.1 anionic cell wall polymer biosynthesis LytR-Cps2A-Psr (LCP) family protein [Pectinatus brassicae]
MSGFKNVIDAIGGIDINVDKHLYYYDKYDAGEVDNDGLIDIKAGQQHMDGNTALEYVRFRHDPMGDIGRIGRQQKFANALLTAISTPGIIPQLPAIIRQIQNSFDTDIPITDMLKFSTLIPYMKSTGISTNMVDGTPVYINNISYWVPDIVKMRNQAAKLENIQVNQEYKEQSNILAQAYKKSLDDVKVIIAP